jgi:hypothetical protein
MGGAYRGHTGFWCGDLRERDYMKEPGIDGRIILNWIFRKWAWTRSGLEKGQVVSCCKCDNEPSVSIKCGEFLG